MGRIGPNYNKAKDKKLSRQFKDRKFKRSNNLILNLYFLLAPFAVSTSFNQLSPLGTSSLLVLLVSFTYLSLDFLRNGIQLISKFKQRILLLFTLPIFTSLIGVVVSIIRENNKEYRLYLLEKLPARGILIFINIGILLGLLNISYNWSYREVKNLIKKYYYGLLVFALVAFWQFLHFLIDIPFLNLDTRDYIHSVSSTSFLINRRLTSLADEPSYLAPLAIDLIILGFLVARKPRRTFLLGLLVLVFSYSGGGYLNLFILIIFFLPGYFKYKGYRLSYRNVFSLLILSSLGIGLVAYYNKEIYRLIYPVLGRLDTIFNIRKHGRMFMIFMPFLWVLQGNIIQALFGYGPNSYNYLHLTKYLISGDQVHVTSNNLFADTVFELGYFGLLSYILIFASLIYLSWKNLHRNKPALLSFLLSVHLFTSSIYRADFMQARFWILIFIILKLIDLTRKEEANLNNKDSRGRDPSRNKEGGYNRGTSFYHESR